MAMSVMAMVVALRVAIVPVRQGDR
jgi:hypothetical protein